MPNPLERVIREVSGDNRILLAGAAGISVFLAAQYFRRRESDGALVAPDGGVGAEALAAYIAQAEQRGALAAASGFEQGAGLGAAGFGAGASLGQTAIDVLGASLGGAVSSLAGSQAGVVTAGFDALANIALGALGAVSSIGLGGSGGGGDLGPSFPSILPIAPPTSFPTIQPIAPPSSYQPPLLAPGPVTPPTGSGPSGHIAVFQRPTLVYARHGDGTIGVNKTFGQAGLRIRVNSVVVPKTSHGGGTFWVMKEGGATGWLIRPSDPNVTVTVASAPTGDTGQRLLTAPQQAQPQSLLSRLLGTAAPPAAAIPYSALPQPTWGGDTGGANAQWNAISAALAGAQGGSLVRDVVDIQGPAFQQYSAAPEQVATVREYQAGVLGQYEWGTGKHAIGAPVDVMLGAQPSDRDSYVRYLQQVRATGAFNPNYPSIGNQRAVDSALYSFTGDSRYIEGNPGYVARAA